MGPLVGEVRLPHQGGGYHHQVLTKHAADVKGVRVGHGHLTLLLCNLLSHQSFETRSFAQITKIVTSYQ